MKIGVNTLFMIPGMVGGSETYLCELLRAIPEAAPDLRVVLFTNRENHDRLRALLDGCANADFCPLALRAANRLSRLLQEQTRLPRLARRAGVDILWSAGYTAPYSAPCPQVVSIYDMLHKSRPEDFRFPAGLITSFFVAMAARRSARILTLSEFSRREIVRYGAAPEDRVDVTHLAVDPAFARIVPEAERRRRTQELLGSDRPYLLCVANAYLHKNAHALVNAFGRLLAEIPHSLLIVGGCGFGEPLLRQAIGRLPDPGRVVRLSRLARADLIALYQGADVFVFPSLYEGFGLPVLEAMMAGAPVVTTRRSSIPEIGGDCVLYFDDAVETDLDARIREALGMDDARRREWVSRAHERAMTFDWRRTAEKTVACFRKALAPRGTAHPAPR